MSRPRYPSLFQVNTRVRLSELAAALGRPATLDDIPDAELDRLAADGFDFVWFLGVWQTGEAARRVSRSNPEWLAEYHRVLPDFREDDVCGSCFAIRDYRVHADFGGDEALARLRERLRRAACAWSSTSSRTTWRRTTPGSTSTRTSSSPARRSSSPQRRRTTVAWRRARARASSRTGATRTSPAGPTRCS